MAVTTCHIAAPPAAVFATLSDGWLYSNWVVGTSHMRAVEPDWPAAGSRLFHASGAWPLVFRDETQVERCEPDRLLVLTAKGRPYGEARVTVTLTPAGGGTAVRLEEEPVAGPASLLPRAITDPVIHRRNIESLARLTALAERRVTPP